MERLFTAPYAWHGGFLELALDLGPPSDDRLDAALGALWAHPALDGCYLNPDREPRDQPRVAPVLPAGREWNPHRLHGVATMPNGGQVACLSIGARYQGYDDYEDADSLCLCLPIGALERAYPNDVYPYGDFSLHGWRAEVAGWLRSIGEAVFATVDFRLGLVGHEAEWEATAAEVRDEGVPEERWCGFLWPEDDRLGWYPANMDPTTESRTPKRR